jgi:hypothetical protein
MGFFVNGWMCGLVALMSEAYPTAARATVQNVLFNFGRAIGGMGPLAVGALASKYSYNAAIALLASSLRPRDSRCIVLGPGAQEQGAGLSARDMLLRFPNW